MGYLEIEGVVVSRKPFPISIIEKIDQGTVSLESPVGDEGDTKSTLSDFVADDKIVAPDQESNRRIIRDQWPHIGGFKCAVLAWVWQDRLEVEFTRAYAGTIRELEAQQEGSALWHGLNRPVRVLPM